jgi:hypothetical protein
MIIQRLSVQVKVADLGSVNPGQIVPRGGSSMELFFKTEPMTFARYPNDVRKSTRRNFFVV